MGWYRDGDGDGLGVLVPRSTWRLISTSWFGAMCQVADDSRSTFGGRRSTLSLVHGYAYPQSRTRLIAFVICPILLVLCVDCIVFFRPTGVGAYICRYIRRRHLVEMDSIHVCIIGWKQERVVVLESEGRRRVAVCGEDGLEWTLRGASAGCT